MACNSCYQGTPTNWGIVSLCWTQVCPLRRYAPGHWSQRRPTRQMDPPTFLVAFVNSKVAASCHGFDVKAPKKEISVRFTPPFSTNRVERWWMWQDVNHRFRWTSKPRQGQSACAFCAQRSALWRPFLNCPSSIVPALLPRQANSSKSPVP